MRVFRPRTFYRACRQDGSCGSVMLEFCICFTLLTMLAFGAASIGLSLREHSRLTEAARVAGRAASTLPPDTQLVELQNAVRSTVDTYLASENYRPVNYWISVQVERQRVTFGGMLSVLRISLRRRTGFISDLAGRMVVNPVIISRFVLSVPPIPASKPPEENPIDDEDSEKEKN